MISTLRSVVRFRTYERDRSVRSLSKAANVEDLRAMAKKRLPAGCFDYIDGAAQDEVTAEANVSAYNNYYFCLLYTSPSPRDGLLSRMPCSA